MKPRLFFTTVALALSAGSFAQVFDWENQSTGIFSSVVQTVGGITATGTGVGGNITVTSLGGGVWDLRVIIGGESGVFLPTRVDFDQALNGLSLNVGDNSGDDDGTVTLTAFDASDVQVGQSTLFIGTVTGAHFMTLSAPNMRYFIATTDGVQGPHSVAYDNIDVNPVPEPATLAVFGLGSLALLRRRRNGIA